VAFGPLSQTAYSPDSSAATSEALLPAVRTAAQRLVARLNEAREHTGNWQNAALADALLEAALADCLQRLAATGCWGEANRLPSGELWRSASALLDHGSLQKHARFKPRGYAGDHEMLARICEPSCCDDPLGAAMDRYFLRQAAPAAVRSRTEQTAAALVAHRLRSARDDYQVASVGSGPGIDLQRALDHIAEAGRRRLSVALLDLAPDALEHAEGRLAPLVADGLLTSARTNPARLAQQADKRQLLGEADFLICSGLFDYFDDETAVATLRFFYERLRPGGQMLVGNFAPHNPTRAYMEWIGNWYLHYRSAAELRHLAMEAGIGENRFHVGCERLGVVLFLVARK
jgi:hypothetical protein